MFQVFREELVQRRVPFTYRRILGQGAAFKELRQRLEEGGLDNNAISFPVVDVNGKLMIQPAGDVVIEEYRSAAKKNSG